MGNYGDHLIRKSTRRLVISGSLVELYKYSRPYFYNIPPNKSRGADSVLAKPAEKRDDHILRSRRTIRRLIEANVNAKTKPVFITFTFARNVCSLEEANPLFSTCVKEMQRRWGRSRYLCVPEFQKRGAVHYHVIFFDLPFIPHIKQKMSKLWQHGFCQVKAIRKIKNIGAYVSKYLQKGVGDERSRGKKSYFCSRNMVKPIEYRGEKGIDIALGGMILEDEAVESFQSRQGTVIYSRYRNLDYV